MTGRKIQRGEIVPVVFDVWTFGDFETHASEDGDEFIHSLRDGMDRAFALGAHGQRDVDGFGGEALIEFLFFKGRFLTRDQRGDFIFQGIKFLAFGLTLIRRHAAKRLHKIGDAAFFAQGGNAHVIQCLQIIGRADLGFEFFFKSGNISHSFNVLSGRFL